MRILPQGYGKFSIYGGIILIIIQAFFIYSISNVLFAFSNALLTVFIFWLGMEYGSITEVNLDDDIERRN